MAGDKSKIAIDFQTKGWNNVDNLFEIARLDPEISKLVSRQPSLAANVKQELRRALIERAPKAYAEEWSALKPEEIDRLVARSAAGSPPSQANEFNARYALPEIQRGISRLKPGRRFTIVDLGTGGGGTILPVVEKLSPAQRSRVHLVLVDTMPAGVQKAIVELQRLGVSEKQVTPVVANFFEMSKSKALQNFFGRANLVTAGASLHHTASMNPIFRTVYRLLGKGGTFSFWDWGHQAWRAQNLVVAPKGAVVNRTGSLMRLGKRVERAPREHAFVSQNPVIKPGRAARLARGYAARPHLEVDSVRNMLSTWVSLLRYDAVAKQEFVEYFNRQALKGEPINLMDWMSKNLEGRPLALTASGAREEQANIQVWEGHRPPEFYTRALRQVGFKAAPNAFYSSASNLLYHIKLRK